MAKELLSSGLRLHACREGGKTVTLEAPLGDIPLHMLGGTVSSSGGGSGSGMISSKGSCICCGGAPTASSRGVLPAPSIPTIVHLLLVAPPATAALPLLVQALMMQQEALLTRDVKRSPLTVVVALAEVLAPSGDGGGSGGAGAGRSIVGAHSSSSIVAHMYNDGGEEIEVSAGWPDAPCRLQAAAVDQACRW